MEFIFYFLGSVVFSIYIHSYARSYLINNSPEAKAKRDEEAAMRLESLRTQKEMLSAQKEATDQIRVGLEQERIKFEQESHSKGIVGE